MSAYIYMYACIPSWISQTYPYPSSVINSYSVSISILVCPAPLPTNLSCKSNSLPSRPEADP